MDARIYAECKYCMQQNCSQVMYAVSLPAFTDLKAKIIGSWEIRDIGPGEPGTEGNSVYVYQPKI